MILAKSGQSPLGAQLREVAGLFPTGVTILTAHGSGTPVGMAANSFTSLSLDPPLVLVCVGRGSTTWPALERAGQFCVNILAEEQELLARRFAARDIDRFNGVDFTRSPGGDPLLDGVIGYLDCVVERVLDGGDHLVVVAAVAGLGVSREDTPLVFHRSRFGLSSPSNRTSPVSPTAISTDERLTGPGRARDRRCSGRSGGGGG